MVIRVNAEGAIAFKSVIAYRTGLDVQPVSEAEARRNFETSRGDVESTQKPFRDFPEAFLLITATPAAS